MSSRSTAVFFVLLASLLFACTAAAQTFRGNITGTVTDSTGAAVSGAQVRISSPSTGFSRNVTTNDLGEYVATELPPGSYSVTVFKEGFRALSLNQIPVSVGSPARADAKLTTGQVNELVEVNAEVPLVETTSNTTGGTIAAEQAVELPVNGHDFTKLLELVPGTTSDPVGSTESAGSYGLFTLNGNRGRSNNYLLDGTDMNDGYRNLPAINQAGVWGCPSTILPVDALAELPVIGSPEAEFGRSSGAIVNAVTKSGTNVIHGTLFEEYRSADLAARNYFNTGAKNSFKNNQFGALLSGPIFKDKTFWLLSYEGQRERGALPQIGTVPTTTEIANSSVGITLNPVMQSLLARNPWGPLPVGDASGAPATVTYATKFLNNSDNVIAKIDQHLKLLSPNDLFTGRFYYAHGIQHFPLGMLNTGSSAPNTDTVTPTHVSILSLSYTTVPSNGTVIELRGGYNRFLQQFLPQDLGFNAASIGLNTQAPDYNAAHDSGLPTISVHDVVPFTDPHGVVTTQSYGMSALGSTASDSRGRIDSNYQFFGNITRVLGHHNFKLGGEWRRTNINSFIDGTHRGTLSFSTLADFLSGTIDGGASATGSSQRKSYQNGVGTYFQDSWHLNSKITLNYGVRWDYYGVVGEKNHELWLLNLNTQNLMQVGANGGPAQLYPKDYKDFSPRISMADDLFGDGKLVLRAGVGIYYDGPSQDFFMGNQPYNTPGALAGPAFNNIQFGSPVVSTITAGTPIYGNYASSSAFTVSQNIVTPRYVSYNVNLESQLAKRIGLEVGYVGSQGRHLFRLRDLNQVDNVAGSTYGCGNGTTVTYGNSCFSKYAGYYVNQVETTALSNYNGLQSTLKLQGYHGLTSTLNYTWSHSIDTASDGQDFVPNAAMPDNNFNPHAERANSNFDVRQRVQWYWSYAVPNYKAAKWLTNGWALDGIFNFATGQPYTVGFLFEGDLNGSNEWYGRPDILHNPKISHHYDAASGGYALLDATAFAAPCTWDNNANACTAGTAHPGSEGRNAFRSTSFTNFDLSLTKDNKLGEKVTMQLRVDFFNVFNHVNFSNPLMPNFGLDGFANNNFAPSAPGSTTGKLLSGGNAGNNLITTVATPDVATGNPFLGGGGPRSAQLAMHFKF